VKQENANYFLNLALDDCGSIKILLLPLPDKIMIEGSEPSAHAPLAQNPSLSA